MNIVESHIAIKGLTGILSAIKSSGLNDEVISTASKVIDENRKGLADMFESLPYKAPSAHEGWCQEITRYTMGLMTPSFVEAQVPVEKGQRLWASIYDSITSI